MEADRTPRLSSADEARLLALEDRFQGEARDCLGYPGNALFDYSRLAPFLAFALNNIGDPYVPSNVRLNTHEFEREVLAAFCELTQAPLEATRGYVTSGGTEGNLYGLSLARELFPEGLVYHSEDSHYSVSKILRCLRVPNVVIRCLADGRMDLDDLRQRLSVHRDVPPIVLANIGTTMKGAIDDLAGIQDILRDLSMAERYIHADAALSGMILPFVDQPPPWDFAARIDSIAINGHKMIGSPIPCGVVLAKKSSVDRFARRVEYLDTLDSTLSGSRNAITPLFLWYALRTSGRDGFRQRLHDCLEVADYAVAELNRLGRHAWRHEHSLTVVFDRPTDSIIRKWQLAAQDRIAHLIAMPHVTRERVDCLVTDLAASI